MTPDSVLDREAFVSVLSVHLLPGEHLTERELVVMWLAVIDGLTSPQIAERLVVSPKTVEHHRRNIALKLGMQGEPGMSRVVYRDWCERRAELLLARLRAGEVAPEPRT